MCVPKVYLGQKYLIKRQNRKIKSRAHVRSQSRGINPPEVGRHFEPPRSHTTLHLCLSKRSHTHTAGAPIVLLQHYTHRHSHPWVPKVSLSLLPDTLSTKQSQDRRYPKITVSSPGKKALPLSHWEVMVVSCERGAPRW